MDFFMTRFQRVGTCMVWTALGTYLLARIAEHMYDLEHLNRQEVAVGTDETETTTLIDMERAENPRRVELGATLVLPGPEDIGQETTIGMPMLNRDVAVLTSRFLEEGATFGEDLLLPVLSTRARMCAMVTTSCDTIASNCVVCLTFPFSAGWRCVVSLCAHCIQQWCSNDKRNRKAVHQLLTSTSQGGVESTYIGAPPTNAQWDALEASAQKGPVVVEKKGCQTILRPGRYGDSTKELCPRTCWCDTCDTECTTNCTKEHHRTSWIGASSSKAMTIDYHHLRNAPEEVIEVVTRREADISWWQKYWHNKQEKRITMRIRPKLVEAAHASIRAGFEPTHYSEANKLAALRLIRTWFVDNCPDHRNDHRERDSAAIMRLLFLKTDVELWRDTLACGSRAKTASAPQ